MTPIPAQDVPVVAWLNPNRSAASSAFRWHWPDTPCSKGFDVALVRQSDHLAALAAAQGEGWQDIETAPKDGTTVILAQGNNVLRGYYVVIAFDEKRDIDGRYIDQTDPDEFWMSEDGDIVEPDHWRPQPPLPAPPIPATSPAKD